MADGSAGNREDYVAMLLSRLGNDADSVAQALAARNIRGVQCKAMRCPIARYLHLEGVENAIVDQGRVLYSSPVRSWGRQLAPMPKAAALFISLFDDGHYPALTEPE